MKQVDLPRSVGPEMGQNGVRHGRYAKDIDVELPADVGIADKFGYARPPVAGIVDQDVDFPEGGRGLLHRFPDGVGGKADTTGLSFFRMAGIRLIKFQIHHFRFSASWAFRIFSRSIGAHSAIS